MNKNQKLWCSEKFVNIEIISACADLNLGPSIAFAIRNHETLFTVAVSENLLLKTYTLFSNIPKIIIFVINL